MADQSEVRFALDGIQPWLTQLGVTYGDNIDLAFGTMVGLVHDVIIGRTPRDDVTPRGKAKSHEEHIQASWQIEMEKLGWKASVFTDSPYGDTLEEGKYRGVGPRTQAGNGGIFSRQAVGGIIAPLINDPKELDDAFAMVVSDFNARMDRIVGSST